MKFRPLSLTKCKNQLKLINVLNERLKTMKLENDIQCLRTSEYTHILRRVDQTSKAQETSAKTDQ